MYMKDRIEKYCSKRGKVLNKEVRLYLEKNKGSFILYIPYSGCLSRSVTSAIRRMNIPFAFMYQNTNGYRFLLYEK